MISRAKLHSCLCNRFYIDGKVFKDYSVVVMMNNFVMFEEQWQNIALHSQIDLIFKHFSA